MAGARRVGREAFTRFRADAVLTFPGASAVFAALVLVTRPLRSFLGVPVYTGLLVDQKTKGPFPEYDVVPARRFNILLPKALLHYRARKRIVVIEDTIISGGAMDKLREYFGKRQVEFACCICHQSLYLGNRTAPEIIGLPKGEKDEKFLMPWGIQAYRYEEAFYPQTVRNRNTRDALKPAARLA